jgi:hypothetical protein
MKIKQYCGIKGYTLIGRFWQIGIIIKTMKDKFAY